MAASAADAGGSGKTGNAARLEMQQWQNFPYYMREAQWDLLRSDERQLNKIKSLVEMLVYMGLRCPSERTYCTVCALLCHTASDNNVRAVEEDINRATALLTTVKSILKNQITRAKQLGTPLLDGQYVVDLPANPKDLPGLMYHHIFLSIPPFAPPMDLNPVWRSANAWSCRSTNTRHRQHEVMPGLVGGLNAMQLAQHSAMVASTVMQAMTTGQDMVDLPGFQMLQPGRERRPSQLREVLERAEGSVPDAASSRPAAAMVAATSVPLLALENGSQGTGAGSAAAMEPTVAAAVPATVAEPQKAAEGVQSEADPPVDQDLLRSLNSLAVAHYEKELPDISGKAETEIQKGMKRPAAAVLRKPACVEKKHLKRPAASVSMISKKMKRPASAGGGEEGLPKPGVKKPAAGKIKKAAALQPITRKAAAKKFPEGCSRCRGSVGCSPSCLRRKNYKLVD